MKSWRENLWLWVEWVLLFLAVPLAVGFGLRSTPWIPLLLLVTVGAGVWLARRERGGLRGCWRGANAAAERRQLRDLLLRFLASTLGLVGIVLTFFPERLLQFPRALPLRWAALLVLYPLLSVIPQELLYRAFFVRRYARLFPDARRMLTASALVFAWLHLIYANPLAVALTLIGGVFFAETYARTRSLRLVCLEHALYGNLIFTIGLGDFFSQTRGLFS